MKPARKAFAAPAIGGRSGNARRAVWSMMRAGCLAGALAHAVFLVLFIALGLPLLAWANVASIALFIAAGLLLARRRNWLGLRLIAAEVVVHAAIASWLLGWDSGFHYYLLTLVGPLVVWMHGSTASRLTGLLAFGAAYALLDAWTRPSTPVYRLDAYMIDALRYFNIAGALLIMGFVSLTYYRLVTVAESALRRLASTDPLTGLHNRRHLIETVRDLRAAGQPAHALSVLICDVDHFKRINDRHGHDMGDLVLQRIAEVLRTTVSAADVVGRWGGEEFVVLLDGADAAGALEAGERIRRAVAALRIDAPAPAAHGATDAQQADGPLRLTVTIGVAQMDIGESMDAAIARADAALYRGKAAGRNRVLASADSAPG